MLAEQESVSTDAGYAYQGSGDTGPFEQGQTMSMAEALSLSKGSAPDVATMQNLNRESANSGLGNLFEFETA